MGRSLNDLGTFLVRVGGTFALGGALASCGRGPLLGAQHSAAAGTTAAAGATAAAGTNGAAGATAAAGANGTAGTTAAGGTNGAAGATAAAGTNGAAGSAVSVDCPAGVRGHCNSDTAKNSYPRFTLALAEEFDTPLDLDNDPIWTWSDGAYPAGQTRFDKESITFANGKMIITAAATNVPPGESYAEPRRNQTTGTVPARTVASGELRTKYNNYRFGRYEARFKAPVENAGKSGDGNYVSMLFTFRTPRWSEWNEIDVRLEANIKHRVAYDMINLPDPTNSFPAGDTGSRVPGAADFSIQQFHTYAFEWTPTEVIWFVDGVKLRSNGPIPPIPQSSAKIMMNLWVFGGADAYGDPSNNVYPFSSEYEWFRFYKWNSEPTYPFDNPKVQLPAGDVDFSQNNPNEMVYP